MDKIDLDISTIIDMYFKKNMSTSEIGRILGVSRSTIGRCLLSNGDTLKGRGRQTTNFTPLSVIAKEIINGLLLGDASIYKNKNSITPTLTLNNITKSWIEELKGKLPFDFYESEIPECTNIRIRDGVVINHKRYYVLKTRCDLSLIPFYDSWCPNGIKKIVPPKLILTPTVVKQWFYGDGSCGFSAIKNRKEWELKFSTDGFTFEDVELLQSKFSNIGILIPIQKHNGYPFLQTGKASTINSIFDYMGQCEVEGFKYKWNRPIGIKDIKNKKQDEQVSEIRKLHETGLFTQKELAVNFNTTQSTISQIVLKKSYKNV